MSKQSNADITNSVVDMKPSQMILAIEHMINARIPMFIWGKPGGGKSSLINQVSCKQEKRIIDLRAVHMDPTDFKGIFYVTPDGKANWAIPGTFPTEGRGVLFLDELNGAPPLVLAACYQLILDRRLGDYVLPEGWDVVAAGNNETDRGVTSRMPTPLANRFAHFNLVTDLKDWCTWANKEGIRPELVAFNRMRPELLHDFNPKTSGKAFPSPRTWEKVNQAMEVKPPAEIEFQVYASLVGQAASSELIGFLEVYRNLPSMDLIMLKPDTTEVPVDPAPQYAISGALARVANDENIGRIFTYADRMPDEFTVLTMADASERCPAIQNTKPFIDFAVKYSEVVL